MLLFLLTQAELSAAGNCFNGAGSNLPGSSTPGSQTDNGVPKGPGAGEGAWRAHLGAGLGVSSQRSTPCSGKTQTVAELVSNFTPVKRLQQTHPSPVAHQ